MKIKPNEMVGCDAVNAHISKPIPSTLWHYTSYAGFQGIISSKKIWTTEYRFLNDREEFRHAKNLAQKLVEEEPEVVGVAFRAREELRKAVGIVEEKIARHPVHRQRMSVDTKRGRSAKTEYRVIQSNDRASLIECRLHTGRTHQIRVHLHHLGHPVLGDKVYAPRFAKNVPRQMLHAWKLGFYHPRTGEWNNFEAALPADFKQAIAAAGL